MFATMRQGRCIRRFAALLAATAVLGSCASGEISCPAALPMINVFVRDAVTNLPAAVGAIGVMQLGETLIPLPVQNDLIMAAVLGPPGTYRLLIEKTSYQEWRKDVFVGAHACGTESVVLDAYLQPAS